MNILFNVTTRRGILSILPLMEELRGRGHCIFTLVTTHPSAGLKHPHKFMVGDDEGMTELLDGISEYTIHPSFEGISDLDGMLSDIRRWNIDLHITKGDSGMDRDNMICSGISGRLPHIPIVCQQADYHMRLGRAPHSSHFLTMGQRWSEHLWGVGVPESQTTVVGCIKGDYLRTLDRYPSKYITFVSQMSYTNEEKSRILDTLEEVAVDTGYQLVVKLHPAWIQYDVDEWTWWEERISYRNILTDSINVYSLLQESALSVAAFSNTIYESMIMGVPAVSINISGDTDVYRSSGVDVYTYADLHGKAMELIEGQLSLEDTELLHQWQERQYYTNDGMASQRSDDRIEEIYNDMA